MGKQAPCNAREHGCAEGGCLQLAWDTDRLACHIRLDLEPESPTRTACDGANLLGIKTNLLHAIHVIAQTIRCTLQDSTNHVATSMCQAESEEDAARISIPGSGHGSAQTSEKHEALADDRRLSGFGSQQVIGANVSLHGCGAFMRGKRIEEPAIAATRDKTWILDQPGLGIGMAVGFQ